VRVLGLLTALAWCGALGCGGPAKYQPPPVGGVVVWQDGAEPRELEGGAVEFEGNGTTARAVLTADGTFRLEGSLPPGTYRVRVTPPAAPRRPPGLDPAFESFDQSGLTFTRTSEPQQVTFRVRRRGR
jgi:hypothetical protein